MHLQYNFMIEAAGLDFEVEANLRGDVTVYLNGLLMPDSTLVMLRFSKHGREWSLLQYLLREARIKMSIIINNPPEAANVA